jgi:Tfp pilus assembly protein PilW
MTTQNKLLIAGMLILVVVCSVGLIFFFQNQIRRQTAELKQQQPIAVEGTTEIKSGSQAPVVPVSASGSAILPTEPPAPETAADIDREVEYLDALIHSSTTENLDDSALPSQ